MIADKANFEQPHQYATGMVHVIVNGKAVLQDGKMPRSAPACILYGPARANR